MIEARTAGETWAVQTKGSQEEGMKELTPSSLLKLSFGLYQLRVDFIFVYCVCRPQWNHSLGMQFRPSWMEFKMVWKA